MTEPGGEHVQGDMRTLRLDQTYDAVFVHDAIDGRGARFLEWTWEPDPSDTSVQLEHALLLRDADGLDRTVSDPPRIAAFSQLHWLEPFQATGFEAVVLPEATDENRPPRSLFVSRPESERPSQPRGGWRGARLGRRA